MRRDEFHDGIKVRFHPIIGGKHDGNLYEVDFLGKVCGEDVAWLKGKPGCVSLLALTKYTPLNADFSMDA